VFLTLDEGTLLIHLKNGQTGYFTIADYSEHQLLAKLAPWIHALGVLVGPPLDQSHSPVLSSVADELAKLAALRDQGILTSQEFETQKAKLLG